MCVHTYTHTKNTYELKRTLRSDWRDPRGFYDLMERHEIKRIKTALPAKT